MFALRSAACLAIVVCSAAVAGEKLVADEKAKTVAVAGAFAKQGTYDVLKGAIEYLVVAKGGKEYESILVIEVTPDELHQALLRIGLEPGEPAKEGDPPKGRGVRILAEYEADGKKVRRPADEFVVSKKTGKPLAPGPWAFTGSMKGFDPATNKESLQAYMSRNIVGLHWLDATPLIQNPRAECEEQNIYTPNLAELPKPGTPAVVIFERVMPKAVEGAKRVHVFVIGRVQGVGFRAWTEREARMLKLTGWVKNLADGRVEAIIEGPPDKVAALLDKLKAGPRAAKVEKLDVKDEPAEGGFEGFDIRY
jgi:acylphosphatase